MREALCILSGCPAGARKGHISIFAMLLQSKKDALLSVLFACYSIVLTAPTNSGRPSAPVMAKANGQSGILPFRERGSGGNDGLYQSTSAMTCLVMSAFLLYPRVSSAAMKAAT